MRCSSSSASSFVGSAHSLTRHAAVCRSAPTQHKLLQESDLSKTLKSIFNLDTRMKTNSQMLAGLPCQDLSRQLLTVSISRHQRPVPDIQLQIKLSLESGSLRSGAWVVRDGQNSAMTPMMYLMDAAVAAQKSTAGEVFSRTLDPLHLLKRLSSAKHHAESPLQQTLHKK